MKYKPIGIISTPYKETAPFRPDNEAEGEFTITINKQYQEAMTGLEVFSHIIVLFHFNRSSKTNILVHPPHLKGKETGLFASRSPNRINKIGLDIVKIVSIKNNIITTSPMDILDNTPLLDIKPYIPAIDCHPEASKGHTL
jgi:tRNA-Thr(GGU) m(6)t(6)A37 methyltransferase TsaA